MKSGRPILSLVKPGGFALVMLFLLPLLGNATAAGRVSGRLLSPPLPTQMPGPDRLAEPVLPESPTQVDSGLYLYYFHCMPCHGDRGQGLTDEWRQVWVEDHRNCWARGCHSGKSELSAFFIPRFVPAVIGPPQALESFQTADELFVFLRETQPPQRPGALLDSEYWELTAFLLHRNDRLAPGVHIGPETSTYSVPSIDVILATLMPLLAMLSVLWPRKRRIERKVL